MRTPERAPTTSATVILVAMLVASTNTAASAQSPALEQVANYASEYCLDCHSGQQAEARLDLASLVRQPQFGTQFKLWERAIAALREHKMPPEDMPQPSENERFAFANAIQQELETYIRNNAGDPGQVVLRHLTSAEYAYTILDLTGLDLPLERQFVNDAVGGDGFTNVGEVQFMQDSTLERYLEAARIVADHAVVGAGPIGFFEHPGATGLELSAIHRIEKIYRENGFRSGAGEGAEPFGLNVYPKTFFVAWQYQHKDALGLHDKSLEQLAHAAQISARFAEHIWSVLNAADSTFPTKTIRSQWLDLPDPGRQSTDRRVVEEEARAGSEHLFQAMRAWQQALAASTGNEEESAMLSKDGLQVEPTHEFRANIDWSSGAASAIVQIDLQAAGENDSDRSIVVFREPRIRFRSQTRRWSPYRPLIDVLANEDRQALGFGRHPRGKELDANSFALESPKIASVVIPVPANTLDAQIMVDVELDMNTGAGTPVRCTISDGQVEGETAAESGGNSALLVNPDHPSYSSWEEGVLQFARQLPSTSHIEPAPSDRDPIPAPFDNTYNTAERNLFHTRFKYHRDDDFLVQHILDNETRQQLDQAWTDLLTSFEYHDDYLRFVAGKYGFADQLPSEGIAAVKEDWIESLPAESRPIVARLVNQWRTDKERLDARRPYHVDDVIAFAEQAWRRPLSDSEQQRLRAYYDSLRRADELEHVPAIRALITRVLVSPAFLYRVEPSTDAADNARLTDWQLANRLSYFLWSSAPDAELRQAACDGRLQDPQELARQAERMLRDPKARRFAKEFFGQWFGFYRFDRYQGIDTARFPEFTDELQSAMYNEAVSFFEYIVRENRPIDEILFADYSFLNGALARHYGINDDEHAEALLAVRRGALDGHHRGGLLRLGAVLAVTSAPLRSSPVKRGEWVLRRVLGSHVPPPPADAGSIPADDVLADGMTVRQRLEAHRRDATCAGCHARMDPFGFALEPYDPLGRWREEYRDGQPIDASGTLLDGTVINGPDELLNYLRDRTGDFHRTLCSKLVAYALGRAEIASDRPLLRQMASSIENDPRFLNLVVQVVTSRQFQYQRISHTK